MSNKFLLILILFISSSAISQNIDINTISTATGLSIAEIEKLKD